MSRWSTFPPIPSLDVSSLFVLTFPFPPTESPNLDCNLTERREIMILLFADISTDKEKTPAASSWQGRASNRGGMGEMPSPHQRMLQILAEVSQKPWAASRPSLDCDTFGWCVLPWGCWTKLAARAHKTTSTVLWGKDLLSLSIRLISTVSVEQVAGSSY